MTYPTGIGRIIIAKPETTLGVAAGASGAQIYRRNTFKLDEVKDRYSSNEKRADQQKVRAGAGGVRVEGSLEVDLSCGSHQAWYEATLRKLAAAIADISATLTVAGAGPTYTITRSTGDFIADGVRSGSTIMKATAGLGSGNLNRDLLVTALTTGVATVYPLDGAALTPEGPTSSCTLHVPGKRIIVPATGHIERGFTVEDLVISTLSRLSLGVEVSDAAWDFSPGQDAKVTFGLMGRSQSNAGSAYFTSPTAQTSTPNLSGPKGVILIDGAVQAVVTQLTAKLNPNLSTEKVIGSTGTPAVGQGPLEGTGQLQLLLVDSSFMTKYHNDTPFEVAMYMNDSNGDFMLHHFPECLANGVQPDDPDQLIKQTIPFGFYKKAAATGYDATTMAVQDSQYV